MCCVLVYVYVYILFFSMYMEIMGIRFCVYVKQVSKPSHGVQQGMVGMLLFLWGCVDNCIILCYVFVCKIYDVEWHWCVYCACVKESSCIHNTQQQCSNNEVEFEITEYREF